jgi:hypothetical protein
MSDCAGFPPNEDDGDADRGEKRSEERTEKIAKSREIPGQA